MAGRKAILHVSPQLKRQKKAINFSMTDKDKNEAKL